MIYDTHVLIKLSKRDFWYGHEFSTCVDNRIGKWCYDALPNTNPYFVHSPKITIFVDYRRKWEGFVL